MVRLLKLELVGFGKFAKETALNFDDGINFITGLNEAGKSTILEAILASIFKYTRTQIEPFFCWNNDEVCRTTLTYKTDDGETFRMTSDYKSGKRKLEKIEKGRAKEIATVDKNIDPIIKAQFGFDDKKVFENTAFIRQSQMAILEDNAIKNKIRDMIEEVFAGRAEASATKAIAKIKRATKAFFEEVSQLEEEQQELKEELKSADERKEGINQSSEEYGVISKELADKSEKLKTLRETYEKFKEKEGCLSKANDLKEQIKKIDKILLSIKDGKEKREKLIEKVEKYSGYETISERDFSEIRELIRRVEALEASLNTVKKSSHKKKVIEEKLNPKYLLLFILGGILSFSYSTSILFLILGFPLVLYSYKKLTTKQEKEVLDEQKEEETKQLTKERDELCSELEDKTKKIDEFNKNTFLDQYVKYSKIVADTQSISSAITELIKAELEQDELEEDEPENIQKIESKKTELLNEMAIVQNNLKKYKLIDFKQEDLELLERLEPEVAELNNKNVELKTSINTTVSLTESPEEIKERLDAIEERKDGLDKKIEEHALAAEFLELAESKVHQKFTPALEKNAKPILKEITNDKYSDLRVEEDTLDVKIKAPEVKNYVDAFVLSQGARDQLYFALRTAMSDLLSGNVNMPLILDDPFHNFDNIRLAKTISAIKQISKNKQILLISHRPYHQEFKNFANKVVEL